MRWTVCVTAAPCCAATAPDAMTASFSGAHPHYAPGAVVVPLRFRVEETGFFRCWWPWILAGSGGATFLWLAAGFVRPHSFDPATSVRCAGSEAGLKRTAALVLRELPGGQRGFYRHGRICLNASGDFIRAPKLSVLVIEAAGGGTSRIRRAAGMERKDRRTNKWEAVPESEYGEGPATGVVYRLGNLYVKFD